jgi:hypothetical protein
MMKRVAMLASIALAGLPGRAAADTISLMGRYVGYTIVAEKTVKGWVDPSKGTQGDSFEGCEYGRQIIFDDNTYLTCTSYSYSYSYRPSALLLSNGTAFVMVVQDEAYAMSR